MLDKLNIPFSNQFRKFIAIGISTVLIDMFIYYFLINISLKISIAKIISFACGSIYSYKINKNWTFNSYGGKEIFIKFLFIYISSMFINVSLNSLIINKFNNIFSLNFFIIILAFFLSTLFSAMFNFYFLKNYVFKKLK